MDEIDDRYLSPKSLLSLLFALVSLIAFVSVYLVLFSVVSIFFGIVAIRDISRYQLRGKRIAIFSLVVASVTLVYVPSRDAYLYRSEVLPSYKRLNYGHLTAKSYRTLDQFDGQKICLKGYAIFERFHDPTAFLFSPDGVASFGKTKNAVTVTFSPGFQYEESAIAVSGVLVVDKNEEDLRKRYSLKAEKIVRNRTEYDLYHTHRKYEGC